MKRQFLAIDKNGRGKISLYEVEKIWENATSKISLNGIAALITEFNLNGVGKEEKDIWEFLNTMSKKSENKELAHKAIILRSAMRHELTEYEQTDPDGKIDANKFRNGVQSKEVRVSEAQFNGMMKDADFNGEGRIEYDDFSLVMKKIERSQSFIYYITPIKECTQKNVQRKENQKL